VPAPADYAEPRAECVLVGGFTECIEKYFETIGDLASRGFAVSMLDWRGQGGSVRPGRRPSRPRPRHFARDAEDLALFAQTVPQSGRPLLLIAHSMGGAIALLCLRRHPGLFRAAVLSAPMLDIDTAPVPFRLARCLAATARLSGLGGCFVPGAGPWRADRVPSPETSRISADAERCRVQYAWFRTCPSLRVDGPTFGWLSASLRVVARVGRAEHLRAIGTPILLASAGIDRFVAPEAHRRAARLLPDCTLVDLPLSKHEPFLERDFIRNRWLAAIDDFAVEHLDRAS
jgi:lysophospholipase